MYEIKPGKALKPILEEVIKYQILNPDATMEEI